MRTNLVVLVLLIGTATGVQAARDVHLRPGMKAFKAADYVKASEELSASLSTKPKAKTALYLGNAYLKLGQLGKAKEALGVALTLDPKSKKRDAILKLIEIINARDVGVLKIGSTPPGATIRVDGETGARGKAPMELSLPPGRHRVLAEQDGYETTSHDQVVRSDETDTVDFVLRALECELSLAAEPAGSQAAVDGAPAVALPTKIQVKPGEHRVAFTADAHDPKTETLTCDGHTPLTARVSLTLAAVVVKQQAPEGPVEPARAAAPSTSAPAATQEIASSKSPAATQEPASTKAPAATQEPAAPQATAPTQEPAATQATAPTQEPATRAPAAMTALAPTKAPPPIRPVPRRRWVWAVVGTVCGVVVAGAVVGAVLGTQPRDPTPTVGIVSLGLIQ